MSDLSNYRYAQAEREAAYQRLNYATEALENARVRERLAEIKSQHDPINNMIHSMLSAREMLYASAFYVVTGRMPAQGE